MTEQPSAPMSQLGYFDGRQFAAETMIGLLMVTVLDEKQKLVLRGLLDELSKDVHADSTTSREFEQGFRDCVKRLKSFHGGWEK